MNRRGEVLFVPLDPNKKMLYHFLHESKQFFEIHFLAGFYDACFFMCSKKTGRENRC